MKARFASSAFFLVLTLSAAFFASNYMKANSNSPDCYVGISFCGNTSTEAKLVIDRVKNYTNLFVLQSGPISGNETATTEICDYAVEAGLNIIVFFGDLGYRELARKDMLWRLSWLDQARPRYGNKLLGIYYYDEPAGIQLDYNWTEAGHLQRYYNITYRNYAAAETYFTQGFLDDPGIVRLDASGIDSFTADYALYWFDYLGGYEVVLAEIGWNHTLSQDIGLVRGAANLQNKDWGTILTWKYRNPPYLDDADAVLEQMITSYESGAKYIVIFNYAPENADYYGTMTDEHYEALETFWNDVVTNPEVIHGSVKAEAVLVLPAHYAWGMRSPADKIWGFWEPDEKSPVIWDISRQLLEEYGYRLDIVYDDPDFPVEGKYQQIYYWNDTIT